MKRLVVCCDGTWNKLDAPCPTNVVRIAQATKPVASNGIHQVLFYEEGLGTAWYDRIPGGAFGWGIDTNIQNAYRFLSLNYEPGDEIYLFGFSRGAYTVRSLAGLIHCSGLLSRQHIYKAPEAYQLYRDRAIKPSNSIAEEFRATYGKRVPITVLGCWDTVGSLGVPNIAQLLPFEQLLNSKYRFHDTELSSSIQNALHAVAIDELRKVFNVTPMQKSSKLESQQVRQVWFPGGHGCVGGGTEGTRGLSDGALAWMMSEIHQLGLNLEFDPSRIQNGLIPNPNLDFNNNPGFYRLSGTIHRQVDNFANLDSSVKKRWCSRPDYRPVNLQGFAQELNNSCQ